MVKNPEILAPAGSIDIVYATTAMGADAVYVGAPRFGARAFAKNPSVEELAKAIVDLHLRGKRLYLTTNTLLTDRELEELPELLKPLVEAGLDAAIVQDPGVLVKLHECFPDLALHASTQMALFSGDEAELLRPYGVTRFVPARELTIEEIRAAREQTGLEIEVFVHGALCVCYSGWCLMSEYIGGRSGNRGACAGPCRLPYTRPDTGETGTFHARTEKAAQRPSYELNAKDSETLLHIPELIEAGIDSFKIEGRMKSREYASYIAYLYRHYSDVYLEEGPDHYRELLEDRDSELWRDRKKAMELYNRGGFFSSYLFAGKEEPTIETLVKGHYGLPVGTVTRVNKPKQVKESSAQIRLNEELHSGDVLAIRDAAGETFYEFTVGEASAVGTYTTKIGFSEVREGYSVFRTKNKTLLETIDQKIDEALAASTVSLEGHWIGRIGEPVSLSVSGLLPLQDRVNEGSTEGDSRETKIKSARRVEVTVTGEVLQAASRRPVTEEDVSERLRKLGGSGYVWETLAVEMEEGAFLPLKAIKELRRQAIIELEKHSVEIWHEEQSAIGISKDEDGRAPAKEGRETPASQLSGRPVGKMAPVDDICPGEPLEDATWISVQTMGQLSAALIFLKDVSHEKTVLHVKLGGFSALSYKEIHSMWERSQKENPNLVWAFSLPRPWRGSDRERLEADLVDFFSCFTKNPIFMANSMASLVFRGKYCPDWTCVADENLYMWNSPAVKFYQKLKVYPGPKRIYGRIPVMTTNHRISEGEILTPKRDRFLVVKPEGCDYRMIYTAEPVTTGRESESEENGHKSFHIGYRIDLTTETGEEILRPLRRSYPPSC